MNTQEASEVLRSIIGPDVWAKEMLAAIAQGESEEYMCEEFNKATPEGVEALKVEINRQEGLLSLFATGLPTKVNCRGTRLVVRAHRTED